MKFTFQTVFDNSRQNTRTATREVARSHSSFILSFALIGQHQNKRFHVTEIVLLPGFTDVIFQRERSEDWKYVCGSQARFLLVHDCLKRVIISFDVTC